MPDVRTLIENMRDEGAFDTVARNPLAQFGTPTRQLLGAQILPNRQVPENMYREETIRYRTTVANHGTRYSPVQKKKAALIGGFDVVLAEQDIGSELTAAEYDALVRFAYLMDDDPGDMRAVERVTRFVDSAVNMALEHRIEVDRWTAIVEGIVRLRGDNEYKGDVLYSNPTGHRLTVAAAWTDANADPYADIQALASTLTGKGYRIRAQFAGERAISRFLNHPKVRALTTRFQVNAGVMQALSGPRLTRADMNALFAGDNLPAVTEYNATYHTNQGDNFFLHRDAWVLVGETDNVEEIDVPDDEPIRLEGTLGYTGIGRAAGQPDSGRVLVVRAQEDKPPRIEAQGWQTSLPVIQDPEAIGVLRGV